MPDSRQCLDARASLAEIRSLRSEFESAYGQAASYGNPDGAARAAALRAEIEGKVAALRDAVFVVEVERTFDLRRQYDAQTSLLRRAGLVETAVEKDESGAEKETLFMTGIDGKKYPLPSYETVVRRIAERRELLGTKADQGFVKILLVPVGMPLRHMLERFGQHLRNYKLDYDAAHRNDIPPGEFHLDTIEPVFGEQTYADLDVLGEIVYDPSSFGSDHGGKTKAEVLAGQEADGDSAAGWRVLLLQAGDDGRGFKGVPRKGAGKAVGTEHPRADVEAGKSADECLADQRESSQREDSPYRGESGMCLEDWLVLFLAQLEETGKLLDDQANDRDSDVFLTGAYRPYIHGVPWVCWMDDSRMAWLDEESPGLPADTAGPRFVVKV